MSHATDIILTRLQDEEIKKEEGATSAHDADSAEAQPEALKDVTNEAHGENQGKSGKSQARPRERRERGPPADGIPSKTKVMVANLPYDLTEEKVRDSIITPVVDTDWTDCPAL
jgi:hypothetical protein